MGKNKIIVDNYKKWANSLPEDIKLLPQSGSSRKYYRVKSNNKTVLVVINNDYKENIAFINFSKTFKAAGIKVPLIYFENLNDNIYIIEDLGDTTLYSLIEKNGITNEILSLYKKVISNLPKIQIEVGKKINYNLCYPRDKFDKQSMQWDLNYFKYFFLKLAHIDFYEQELENDFNELIKYLLDTDTSNFLFRDFQSRNIMIKNNTPYFIDYQGGRRGALQYDIASLLFDAKAKISNNIRKQLLDLYINELKKYTEINEQEFLNKYYAYVLIRIMQAMGAYGYRGYFAQKIHFLTSISPAVENLKYILTKIDNNLKIPELRKSLIKITESQELKKFKLTEFNNNKLTVRINSFSYKQGIPKDLSGNGGGFVFDCRAIHNPGRYDEYKKLTGKDKPVIDFLNNEPDMTEFLKSVFNLVSQSVKKYQKRNFKNLMVSFGCTGGQHRSVYSAENL
ncbi:MAG: phosphotransferase enzyme family protein, partial [Bacteroidetes bacterium]